MPDTAHSPTMNTPLMPTDTLGPHPELSHILGRWLICNDTQCVSGVGHRVLEQRQLPDAEILGGIQALLREHHADPEKLESIERRRAILISQGLPQAAAKLSPYPKADTTRKCNLVEVVLAEYCRATAGVDLPIYRLRYNPNKDQSMKGDDVLAFDLDADPVRIVVGEAKFRGTPNRVVVQEIISGLEKSYAGEAPTSLEFVASCLRSEGRTELATRIEDCYQLCITGRIRVDYAGMLLSNKDAARHMRDSATSDIRRLVVISLGVPNPNQFVNACWNGV